MDLHMTKRAQDLRATASIMRASIRPVIIPPLQSIVKIIPAREICFFSGRTFRIALVYDATPHAKDTKDAIAEIPGKTKYRP